VNAGEIAVEHVARAGRSDPGAQILHQLIGLKYVRADLMPPTDIGFGGVLGIGRLLADLQLALIKARAELVIRFGAVLVLRSLVLALDDDAGWQVGDAHCGIGRVDMLAARAGCAIGVDTQFALIDIDFDIVVDHGIDPDR
jgi:hypothetical protein